MKILYKIVSIFKAADDLELVLNKAKPPSSCFEILRKIKKYYFVIEEFNFALFLSISEISFNYLKLGLACDHIVKTNGFLRVVFFPESEAAVASWSHLDVFLCPTVHCGAKLLL